MASKAKQSSGKIVKIVFIALLCDLFAFTMPLPLFPRLINNFIAQEQDATGTLLSGTLAFVRSVRHLLSSFQTNSTPAILSSKWDLTLLGGLLASLFSFCQFIISPYIGHLSDKYGRKPILLISMIGNIISALLWLFADSFSVYTLSRIVGGLSEGNVQLSIACISDVTDSETRSKSLALVGIAFSLAFTIGPVLGAYLSQKVFGTGQVVSLFGRVVRLNVYAVPAAFCLGLLLCETIYLAVCLPETRWFRTEAEEKDSPKKENVVPRTLQEKKSRLYFLQWVHFGFLFFFSGAEFTLTFLTYNLFAYTNSQNGRLLGFIGVFSALLQGGYTRKRSATPTGLLTLLRSGTYTCFMSLFLLSVLPHITESPLAKSVLYLAASGFAFVSASVVSSMTAMVSLECTTPAIDLRGKDALIDKGLALGKFRSRGQLGRALGPLVSTAIYWVWGPSIAYGYAALGALIVANQMKKLGLKIKQE